MYPLAGIRHNEIPVFRLLIIETIGQSADSSGSHIIVCASIFAG